MNSNYYIEVLREKLKQKLKPQSISVKSTEFLSENIYEKINKTISPSTLQRFFGLITVKSALSKSSLDILSEYAGYSNWESFCNNDKQHYLNKSGQLIPDKMGLILFEIALKNHNFITIVEYIKLLPSHSQNNSVLELGELLQNVLLKDKKAKKNLLPKLARIDKVKILFPKLFK